MVDHPDAVLGPQVPGSMPIRSLTSAAQLPRLHRILALKDLGFPLDRIAPALESGVSADALRGMLMLRQAEQEQTRRKESDRLTRLKALLQLIEKEGMRAGEVVLKDAPPQTIASIRSGRRSAFGWRIVR